MLTQNQKTNYDEERNSLTGGILSNLREVGDMSSMLVSKEVPGHVPDDDKSEVSNSDLEATPIYHCASLEDLVEELSDDFSFDQDSGIFI